MIRFTSLSMILVLGAPVMATDPPAPCKQGATDIIRVEIPVVDGESSPIRLIADFAPGTSQSYIQGMTRAIRALHGAGPDETGGAGTQSFVSGSRWPGSLGDPIALTWSLVPDGTAWMNQWGNLLPSTLFSTLDAQYASVGGRQAWLSRFQLGFQRWDELSGVDFTWIAVMNDADDGLPWNTVGAPGARGDIRLGMVFLDGPLRLLAFAILPGTGSGSAGDDGDIVFDSAENWFTQSWSPVQGFNRTITHEIGHALGMQHVCPSTVTKLMEPFAAFSLATYGPQHDDVRGVQSLYGDPFEPNETLATASPLQVPPQVNNLNFGDIQDPYGLPPGDYGPWPISSGLMSIDSPDDVDVYSFGIHEPTWIQVVLRPIGLTYQEAPQTCSTPDGCCASSWTHSHNITNLRLELLDRNGVLLAIETTSGGSMTVVHRALQLVNVPYYVRVTPISANFPGPQPYDLEFTTHPGPPCGEEFACDDSDPCNGWEICLPNGSCYVIFPGGDCNGNLIDDSCDIAWGTSIDCDANGVPDECETDCNNNGILDSCDIASGFSMDCDSNKIPDECELDCNNNDIVDACDILQGTSIDDNHNGVPDECESTLRVPSQYATLRAAVTAAGNGDTILVAPGTYWGPDNRNIDIVDMTLQILAEGCPANTTIDIEGQGRAFFVRALNWPNRTRIEGFTIRNGDARFAPAWGGDGGAIHSWAAELQLEKCVLRDNRAETFGGALLVRNDGGGENPEIRIQNCLFHDNRAAHGGAAYVMWNAIPTFVGCTFTENVADWTGGALASMGIGDGAAIVSSIVWRNGPLADQLAPGGMSFAVLYTDLPPQELNDFPGPGNISLSPQFVNPSSKDFHIQASSPCRNAGHPFYSSSLGLQDIDCQPRFQEGRVDMGADERGPFEPIDPLPGG